MDPVDEQGVQNHFGKTQVIWVFIGNKLTDPLGGNWTPSPLENDGHPLEPWKIIVFFEKKAMTPSSVKQVEDIINK